MTTKPNALTDSETKIADAFLEDISKSLKEHDPNSAERAVCAYEKFLQACSIRRQMERDAAQPS